MTTIIAVRGVGMYSDSRCTTNLNFSTRKIHRAGRAIVGGSGSLADVLKFVEWVKAGGKKKIKRKEFDALVMNKKGLFLHNGTHADGFEILDDRYAIGSGAVAAMAAMQRGASPKQALEIAAKFDVFTGGKMQFLALKK